MLVGADVPVAPPLVVAFAVKTYVPAGAFDHVTLYGAVRSWPSDVRSRKNSTLVIDPVGVLAVASMTMVAGAAYVAPLAGDVRVTDGGSPAGSKNTPDTEAFAPT